MSGTPSRSVRSASRPSERARVRHGVCGACLRRPRALDGCVAFMDMRERGGSGAGRRRVRRAAGLMAPHLGFSSDAFFAVRPRNLGSARLCSSLVQ